MREPIFFLVKEIKERRKIIALLLLGILVFVSFGIAISSLFSNTLVKRGQYCFSTYACLCFVFAMFFFQSRNFLSIIFIAMKSMAFGFSAIILLNNLLANQVDRIDVLIFILFILKNIVHLTMLLRLSVPLLLSELEEMPLKKRWFFAQYLLFFVGVWCLADYLFHCFISIFL